MLSEGVFGKALAAARRHWILLAMVALFLLWWGVPTARKAYYDSKVRAMCAQDGGIKVYEQVKLPADRFDQWGGVRIPIGARAKPTDEFVMNQDMDYYQKTNSISGLELWRYHATIVRSSDSKILGELVSYTRRGGDPIQPWESSWYTCSEKPGEQTLIQRVFIRE